MALVSAAHAATSAGIRTQAAWLLRHDQQSKWSLQNEGTIARARSTSKPLPVGRCRIQTSNQAKVRQDEGVWTSLRQPTFWLLAIWSLAKWQRESRPLHVHDRSCPLCREKRKMNQVNLSIYITTIYIDAQRHRRARRRETARVR